MALTPSSSVRRSRASQRQSPGRILAMLFDSTFAADAAALAEALVTDPLVLLTPARPRAATIAQ